MSESLVAVSFRDDFASPDSFPPTAAELASDGTLPEGSDFDTGSTAVSEGLLVDLGVRSFFFFALALPSL